MLFSCKNSLHRRHRFLAQAMEELGAIKMNNFKKRHNDNAAVKGSPKTVSKIEGRTHQVEKVDDKIVTELLIILKQLEENSAQLSQIIAVFCEKSNDNEDEEEHNKVAQMNDKIMKSMEEKDERIIEISEEKKDSAVTHSQESNRIAKIAKGK